MIFTKLLLLKHMRRGYGLGAVLMQDNILIAFYSHTLGVHARMKLVYERELMAIIFALQSGVLTCSRERFWFEPINAVSNIYCNNLPLPRTIRSGYQKY